MKKIDTKADIFRNGLKNTENFRCELAGLFNSCAREKRGQFKGCNINHRSVLVKS